MLMLGLLNKYDCRLERNAGSSNVTSDFVNHVPEMR